MKLRIKTEKIVKIPDAEIELTIPEKQTYWFLSGVRASICITPRWTFWKSAHGEPEEIEYLDVVSVYSSHELKIIFDRIHLSSINSGYYRGNARVQDVIEFLKNPNYFEERTKERFEADYRAVIRNLDRNLSPYLNILDWTGSMNSEFGDEEFMDELKDGIQEELFSFFHQWEHVRVGKRIWKIDFTDYNAQRFNLILVEE